MESHSFSEKEFDSDASSHPYFFSKADLKCRRPDGTTAELTAGKASVAIPKMSLAAVATGAENSGIEHLVKKHVQDMVLRTLKQSTVSLVNSSSGLLHFEGEAAIGYPNMSNEILEGGNKWSELEYLKAEARQKRKPQMMRTSVGEESNSEADFPIPPNSTLEQRSLRTRKLNRWRAKRANDLTSNRKALKKLPYIIHVDGTSKPRGIHKHLWKKVVRGQCGRLDPTMDNINHHPKHIVDSIWHALEKEWEFQGFAHKAREMFEKSTTKSMRNKKMQLKYKCKKLETGVKPEDVSPTHWRKIVEFTNKSVKKAGAGPSSQSIGKGKSKISEYVMGSAIEDTENEGIGDGSVKDTMELNAAAEGVVVSDGGDVDAQMNVLRKQLMWLENQKKVKQQSRSPLKEVFMNVTEGKRTAANVRQVAMSRKENAMPILEFHEKDSALISVGNGKGKEPLEEGHATNGTGKLLCIGVPNSARQVGLNEEESMDNESQMECGDVICIAAIMEGKEEDIGKGILMGLLGSKLYRKVISSG